MDFFMSEYGRYIVVFHVLAAAIWVGGMIMIRFAVHPTMVLHKDDTTRILHSLEIMKRMFMFAMLMGIIIILMAALLIVGFDFKSDPTLSKLQHMKEAVWMFMFINLIFMVIRRKKAYKAFKIGDRERTVKTLKLITNVMIPINIALGLFAFILGVMMRGL